MKRLILTVLFTGAVESFAFAQSGMPFSVGGCSVSGTPCGTAATQNTGTSGTKNAQELEWYRAYFKDWK